MGRRVRPVRRHPGRSAEAGCGEQRVVGGHSLGRELVPCAFGVRLPAPTLQRARGPVAGGTRFGVRWVARDKRVEDRPGASRLGAPGDQPGPELRERRLRCTREVMHERLERVRCPGKVAVVYLQVSEEEQRGRRRALHRRILRDQLPQRGPCSRAAARLHECTGLLIRGGRRHRRLRAKPGKHGKRLGGPARPHQRAGEQEPVCGTQGHRHHHLLEAGDGSRRGAMLGSRPRDGELVGIRHGCAELVEHLDRLAHLGGVGGRCQEGDDPSRQRRACGVVARAP